MALSQKHKGAILVPWFCTNEWKYVYDLLYSPHSEDYHKREALKIIKMWKARMPLFQSGLEGTLSILEALFPDGIIEGEYLQLLQSTAIMRFLNICVSGHTKQATIYNSAKTHRIPKWIVDIRHNLAHSQKLTSLSKLKSALEFCMQWLKTSYWDYHYNSIKDYTPLEYEERIKLYLRLYCDILTAFHANLNIKGASQINKKLLKHIQSATGKEFSGDDSVEDILDQVWQLIMTIRKENKLLYTNVLIDELLENTNFVNANEDSVQTDDESLSLRYSTTWSKLIVVFNKSEIVPLLIRKLFMKTADENCNHRIKYCCSLCLNEIFKSLRYAVQKPEPTDNNKFIDFSKVEKRTLKKIETFVKDVVENPNLYTNNYIKPLLHLFNKEQDYIEKVELFINSYTANFGGNSANNKNIENIPNIKKIIEQTNCVDSTSDAMECNEIIENEQNAKTKNSRWQLIEDKSMFNGCALGLWPGQEKDWNPLLNRIDI